MSRIQLSKIFVFALVILVAFASELANFYLTRFPGYHFEAVTWRADTEKTCDNKVCTQTFQLTIPTRIPNEAAVSLGRIFNAAVAFCGEKEIARIGSLKEPVSTKDVFNRDFVFRTEGLSQKCLADLKVKVFAPINQRKFGFERTVWLGDSTEIGVLIAMHEFINRDLKTINLCIMVLVLLFSFLIRIVTVDSGSEIRVKIAVWLAALALAQSGLLELILPLREMPEMNRWFAAIAFAGAVSYSFRYFLKGGSKALNYVPYLGLSLFLFLFLLTGNRIDTWIDFTAISCVIYLVAGIYKKSALLSGAAVLLFTTTLDFLGIPLGPNSYAFPTLIAGVVILENQSAFISFLKINRLLKLSKSKGINSSSRSVSRFRTHSIIKVFQRQFKVGRLTVLNLSDPEVIKIQQYTSLKQQPESWNVKELPPIFAHVITTTNALVNVHSDSALVSALRRGSSKLKVDSNYFTVIPILAGRETIGGIALTDYDSDQFKSSLNHSTFLFCLDILKGLLVEHLLTMPKTESLNKIAKLSRQIDLHNLNKYESLTALIDSFAEILNSTFGWRIISATLPTSDNLLAIGKIFSFDSEIEKQVRAGKIYAHKDNLQGPLALAVHERKPVVVPNTKWLEGVVHSNTNKFFYVHGTKTAAFVPVLDSDGKTIGVYWIEGVKEDEITYSDRELFFTFMGALTERVKLVNSAKQLRLSNQSLAQFMPKHLVEDFLAGKSVSEPDFGFLMMFDVKGSTNLSNAISNEQFHSEMKLLKDALLPLLTSNNWALRQFVWDGFDFTYTSREEQNEKISVAGWLTSIEPVFDSWKNDLIGRQGDMTQTRSLSFRICFTFGDTTRGIVVEGDTQKWTFTGNASAVVSKVEQAAKQLPGKVFCDRSMHNHSQDSWNALHTTNQGLVVYGLEPAQAIRERPAA